MNSDVHRHQAHPPLAQHGGACGWYSASAAPAPTAPTRIKRAQPPHHLPTSGGVTTTNCNGPHAPLSPTALQNNMMSSSVRAVAPPPPPLPPLLNNMNALHPTPATTMKGPSDLLVTNSNYQNQPLVGSRLINMTQDPWHHGSISRERAEALLSNSGDGVFLVRESTNFPGDHTLCVRYQGQVQHYRVKWATAPESQVQRFTIDDEEFFDNMTDLIQHYLNDADGLCTKLVRWLPKVSSQPQVNHPPLPPPYPPTPSVTTHAHAFPAPPTTIAPLPPHQPPPPLQNGPSLTSDQTDSTVDHKFVHPRWIIAERDLEIRENIGKGEFGDVMLGILNGSQKVAVKILKDKEAATKFRAEASVMASLRHENLVRLLGLVFSSNGATCIVTEHCAQGSLLDYLRSRGRHYVTHKDQINFAYDTCCGMEYLEKQQVVHRDLAARNVLVSEEGRAKVADFGLARHGSAREPVDQARLHSKLPIKWTAPEALKHNKFSNKSDMWSFGILLWEIYSFGRVPYPRIPLAEVVRHVERGYRMEAPDGCPPGPYEIMRDAWHPDPNFRPTFALTKLRLAAIRAQENSEQPQH